MGNKVALHNLGCKVNAYEIEAMQQLLEEAGYEIVPFEPGADIYVINTCTVTNIADRKSRQMLHKAKKMNPDAIVVATGCYAQADTEKLKEDTAVDLIRSRKNETGLEEAGETGKEDTYQDFDTLEALKILEPREKAVIVLRFFEDQKLEDIARTLQENTNTVKTILYRSLKKLRVELTEGELLYEG